MPEATFTSMVLKHFKGDAGSSFIKEVKQLTDDDKRDLWHGFQHMGEVCQVPVSDKGGPIDCSENPRNY